MQNVLYTLEFVTHDRNYFFKSYDPAEITNLIWDFMIDKKQIIPRKDSIMLIAKLHVGELG